MVWAEAGVEEVHRTQLVVSAEEVLRRRVLVSAEEVVEEELHTQLVVLAEGLRSNLLTVSVEVAEVVRNR
jgi:hypothetical protein